MNRYKKSGRKELGMFFSSALYLWGCVAKNDAG